MESFILGESNERFNRVLISLRAASQSEKETHTNVTTVKEQDAKSVSSLAQGRTSPVRLMKNRQTCQ